MPVSPSLRRQTPQRTFDRTYAQYRSYKPHLRNDFNHRCGYCDTSEMVIGHSNFFHVDHFAPKKKFEGLELEYSNLVYSCPSCNNAKSNDWPMSDRHPSHDSNTGYVDPCCEEYDEHLYRAESGAIQASSPVGEYMHHKLKLYLKKHELHWNLDIISTLIENIKICIANHHGDDTERQQLEQKHNELTSSFFEYYSLIQEDRAT